MKVSRIAAIVVGLLLLLGAIAYMAIESAFQVKETVTAKVPDSTGSWEGIIVQRDAGATVSTSYSIRIRGAGSNEKGNEVLLIDKVEGPDGPAISWAQNSLKVTLPSRHQVFKKLDSTKIANTEVKVTYAIR